MANYNFKIQPRFLDNVRNGFKKHEYRLYSGEKAEIKMDDQILLVSNNDEKNYSKVIVTSVTRYSTWEEALEEDWESDFANIASTKDEALNICKSFYPEDEVRKHGIVKYGIQCIDGINYKALRVELVDFSDIDPLDIFFKNLKEDYIGFDNWFHKKQVSHETAYVLRSEKGIQAFLYLKIENGLDSDITPTFPNKRRLKIGTFKVGDSARGFRLGERFLKIAFDNAIKNSVDEIYITLFEKRNEVVALRNMLVDWGFTKWGAKGKYGESVYVKQLVNYDCTKTVKSNFPILKDDVDMHYLPIMAKYHTKLFPDLILKTERYESFYGLEGSLYSLEKIYISYVNPYNKGAKNGDLLVIYHMGEISPKHYSSTCTGLAVLANAKTYYDLDSFIKDCKNKTVFSDNELKEFFITNKYRTVIKLIQYEAYTKRIPLYKLRELGLIEYDKGPRPFDKIDKKTYNFFKNHI